MFDDYVFQNWVEVCEIPVEGNASAVNDEVDRKIEEEINKRLEEGDKTAWCNLYGDLFWQHPENDDIIIHLESMSGPHTFLPGEDIEHSKEVFKLEQELKEDLEERLLSLIEKGWEVNNEY